MNITLISPRLSIQKGDFIGSGIPYWPIELATLATFLKKQGHNISIIDLFGYNPRKLEDKKNYYLQGVPISIFKDHPGIQQTNLFFIYAISYMSHQRNSFYYKLFA